MDDWRSAVDERTGRTYWYHRLTRESTWTRPECFDTIAESVENDSGYDYLLHMLDGLGTPDVLVELLHDPSVELQSEAVQLFLSCCIPSTVMHLAKETGAIQGLLAIAMQSTTSKVTRRQALRSLCSMALNEQCTPHFASNQGWIVMASQYRKWGDLESGVLYIFLLCLLLKGESKDIPTDDILSNCRDWLLSRCGYRPDNKGSFSSSLDLRVLHEHSSSQGISLLSGSALLPLSGATNSRGNNLPGVLLLTLAGHCLRDGPISSIFMSMGGVTALQLLCGASAPYTSTDLREEAADLLSVAVHLSPSLRRRLIGSWAVMSCDLSVVGEVHGNDPTGIRDRAEGNSILYRDVELRPRGNGTPWRLSSALLWARCPGMREVLSDFWDGYKQSDRPPSGGLEVSVDASGEVLTLLVHYMHTGTVVPIPSYLPVVETDYTQHDTECSSQAAVLLELCRVASELDMIHLETLSIESYCQLIHSSVGRGDSADDGVEGGRDKYLHRTLALCEQWGLEKLHVAIVFLLQYGYPMSEEEMTEWDFQSTAHSTERSKRPPNSPSGLHQMVLDSLHDVNEILEPDQVHFPAERTESHPGYGSNGRKGTSSIQERTSSHQPQKQKNTRGVQKTAKKGGGSKGPPKSGGIYKLLLEEAGEGDTAVMGTQVDDFLNISNMSAEHDVGSSLPMRDDSSRGKGGNKSKTKGGRGGGHMTVQEFIPTQHSLEPVIPKKLTPSQKRLEEISKPKQLKEPKKKPALKPSNSTTSTTDDLKSTDKAATKDEKAVSKNKNAVVTGKSSSTTKLKSKPVAKELKEQSHASSPAVPADSTNDTSIDSPPAPAANDVRASLQLLKKKPRARGMASRSRSGVSSSNGSDIPGSEASQLDCTDGSESTRNLYDESKGRKDNLSSSGISTQL